MGQRHEEHPIRKLIYQLSRNLQSKAGLADTTGPCEGQQSHLVAQQQALYGRKLSLPANQRAALRRQVVGAVIQRVEVGELRWQVRRDKLEYALGAVQVL